MKTYIHIRSIQHAQVCNWDDVARKLGRWLRWVSATLFLEHTQNTDSRIYKGVLQLCICLLHTTIYENRLVP